MIVDNDARIFRKDGVPFFYLADTVWMAFANLSLEEWDLYTTFRQRQGFNALQISILPIQHDMSFDRNTTYPYAVRSDGAIDFDSINEAYFEKAVKMLEISCKKGFTPVLTALWNCYVPTAWAANALRSRTCMPEAFLVEYAAYIAEKFRPFDPIWAVSGDTNFETEVVVSYYETLLKQLRLRCPDSLFTMHMTPDGQLPEVFHRPGGIDFYLYQSGHFGDRQDLAFLLAERFFSSAFSKPIVNGEPCYEGHCYIGQPRRFSRYEVRKAMWQSVLSGAGAGIAYGAHGLWSFYRKGSTFTNAKSSGIPYDWRDALLFKGADDAVYLKALSEEHGLSTMLPWALPAQSVSPEMRASATRSLNRIAIYMPRPVALSLELDCTGYNARAVLLESRQELPVGLCSQNGTTTIDIPPVCGDYLLLLRKVGAL
ncbi:MAG: DUF4038 domain-containing protein [Clostridiales bacterium]|nr:DUF4038 domain-containing protein [Clostridiales bacterium]